MYMYNHIINNTSIYIVHKYHACVLLHETFIVWYTIIQSCMHTKISRIYPEQNVYDILIHVLYLMTMLHRCVIV